MSEGEIVADMRPSELLSGELLAQNGIREPLYLTALRYAGVDITPEKRPEHVDSLVLDDADAGRVRADVYKRQMQSGDYVVTTYRGEPDYWNLKPCLLYTSRCV